LISAHFIDLPEGMRTEPRRMPNSIITSVMCIFSCFRITLTG
jgi:hypothetical protein